MVQLHCQNRNSIKGEGTRQFVKKMDGNSKESVALMGQVLMVGFVLLCYHCILLNANILIMCNPRTLLIKLRAHLSPVQVAVVLMLNLLNERIFEIEAFSV